MAILNDLNLITIDEFKNSSFFDINIFNEEAYNDNTINLAIEMASSNIDYMSGFQVSKKWPEKAENNEEKWVNQIKLACCHYVRYALTKGVDYIRGQQSLSIAGISESINNPNDPLFIPPEVFNYLRKAKLYTSFKSYNLPNIESKRYNSFFSKFSSNIDENSPYNQFLKLTNLYGEDGIIIKKINDPKYIGQIVKIKIDKSIIPDLSDYETKANHDSDIATLEKDITNIETTLNEEKEKINALRISVGINTRDIVTKVDKKKLYIPGEYKYMNTNVNIMPTGWVKVTTPTNLVLSSANYKVTPQLNLYGQKDNGNSTLTIENEDNYVNFRFFNTKTTIIYEYNYLNCNLWIYDPKKEFIREKFI